MTGQLYLSEDDSDHQISSEFAAAAAAADIHLVTAGGIRIPAHRSILASASPVLENIIDRPKKKNHKSSERTIPILGVPSEAVAVFVRFLYSSKCTEEEMDMYGFHLLTLSHAFAVPQLKQRCEKALIQRLKINNVIDLLQLSRLCDSSELYFRSMKLVSAKIKSVEKTEGWKFVQKNDPWLELEILQFIDEIESRKKRRRRHREERSLYLQLSEAMECLEHICTEGCTNIGPYDMEPKKKKVPCQKFSTCRGLELLFRHFASCKKRVNNGCDRCKRMWQLLRLHSSICDNPDLCKVPLCRQFKLKAQQKGGGKGEDEGRWKILIRKVAVAKAMSSLPLHKRSIGGHEVKPSKKELGHHVYRL